MTRSRLLAVALAVGAGLGMLGPAAQAAARPRWSSPAASSRDATLTWGFKESFRAYIDGDIANGEWTTSGGATYETPEFSWSDGTGPLRPRDRPRVRAVRGIGALHRPRRTARHDDRRPGR